VPRAIACALLILIAGVVSADELVFQNGDKLTGTVVGLADGKLKFNSAVAGEVTVAVAQIRSLSTEHPVRVVLPDRRVVEQPIVAGEAGRVRIGDADVALADIRAINPPSAHWGGKAALGFTQINSTINENSLSFLFNLARTGGKDRIGIDTGYLHSRSDEKTTADTWFVNGDYNFARRRRVYGFANGRLQQDHVQHLDLRSILGGGLGYVASEKPRFNFRAEGGLAWLREDFSSAPTRSDVTLRLGYLLDMALWKSAHLKHDFTIYPNISDFSDYYFLAQLAIEQGLTDSLSLELRYILDYDSTPAPDVNKTSSKLIVAVGKTF
jgi:uncharacterized protein DUF481